jgi:hypothetical protein
VSDHLEQFRPDSLPLHVVVLADLMANFRLGQPLLVFGFPGGEFGRPTRE